MTRKSLSNYNCSIARAADVFGDQWSLLILREAFQGVNTYSGFRRALGISRNILTDRLNALVSNSIFFKEQISNSRYRYQLTERGKEILPVLIAMMQWGDRWLFPSEGAPINVVDKELNAPIQPLGIISRSGKFLYPNDLAFIPNKNKMET